MHRFWPSYTRTCFTGTFYLLCKAMHKNMTADLFVRTCLVNMLDIVEYMLEQHQLKRVVGLIQNGINGRNCKWLSPSVRNRIELLPYTAILEDAISETRIGFLKINILDIQNKVKKK